MLFESVLEPSLMECGSRRCIEPRVADSGFGQPIIAIGDRRRAELFADQERSTWGRKAAGVVLIDRGIVDVSRSSGRSTAAAATRSPSTRSAAAGGAAAGGATAGGAAAGGAAAGGAAAGG